MRLVRFTRRFGSSPKFPTKAGVSIVDAEIGETAQAM